MKKIVTIVLTLLMSMSIMACGGSNQQNTGNTTTQAGQSSQVQTTQAGQSTQPSQAQPAWTISIVGVKDTAVEFTSIDFEKLGLIDMDATMKKKDGTEQKQKYTGVPFAKVLESVGATQYSKVTVEAKDGFTKDYAPEDVNSKGALLAVKVDGKDLGDAGPVELISDGKGSNWWVKSVTKLTVAK